MSPRSDDLTDNSCPSCGGELTEPQQFNLMFRTYVGPVEDDASTAYLRPETAQGIFVNFANVLNTTRKKLPLGIAQIGKAFRNEITPGNFIFRDREFEQMEIEYFVKPGTDEQWHQHWVEERYNWYLGLGIRKENVRVRRLEPEEQAHCGGGHHDGDDQPEGTEHAHPARAHLQPAIQQRGLVGELLHFGQRPVGYEAEEVHQRVQDDEYPGCKE